MPRSNAADELLDLLLLAKVAAEKRTPGAPGEDGKDGTDGAPGKDGRDGVDGADGKDGRDGVDGAPGKDGRDGIDGAPGKDGRDGIDGAPGKDGRDGIDGKKGDKGDRGEKGERGKDGKDGKPGKPGLVWRGRWKSGAYEKGDAVEYRGSSYVASSGTSAVPPGAGWDLLAQRGSDGLGGFGSGGGVDFDSLPAAGSEPPQSVVVQQGGQWVIASLAQLAGWLGTGGIPAGAVTVDGDPVTVDGSYVTVT